MRFFDVVAVLIVLPHVLFVRLVDVGDDVEVGAELEGLLDRIDFQAAALKAQQHVLVNHPAQLDQVILFDAGRIFPGFFQALRAPINGGRFRQAPFERAVLFVHLLHEHGIHFEFIVQQSGAPFFVVGFRIDQLIEICALHFAEHFSHFIGPLLFVIHVRVVEVRAHFMLEDPGELLVDEHVIRIVAQPFVAQQFDAALHPAPAIGVILELDRNIVSHVPCLMHPNLREMRFQFGNPIGQLRHLRKFIFVLQIAGAHPEKVGDQTAETAERHGGECQHRRRIFERWHISQTERLAILIH